jgi:hypothetical protein
LQVASWFARRDVKLVLDVTDAQRSRRPIFIATLWAGASWLFFRVARSTRMIQIWALYRQSGSDRLEKQPTDLRQTTSYFGDRTLEPSALGDEVFHSRVRSRRLARSLNQHMRTGKLYPTAACMEPFLREQFRAQVAELAAAGIYVGTLSWKYEDWLGLIYSP